MSVGSRLQAPTLPVGRRPRSTARIRPRSSPGTGLGLWLLSQTTTAARHRDMLFVGAVTALALARSVIRPVFSGRDLVLLGGLGDASLTSISGLARALQAWQPDMPLGEVWYVAALYRLFGAQPLGYQVVNGLLLFAAILLGHLLLRDLGVARILTVALPAVFAAYLTTAGIGVSALGWAPALTLALLSLYADVRWLRGKGSHSGPWSGVALLPLNVLAVLAARSAAGQVRFVGAEHTFFDLRDDVLSTPAHVVQLLTDTPQLTPVLVTAGIGGLLLAGYLWHVSGPGESSTPGRRGWLLLLLAGPALLASGHVTDSPAGGAGVAVAFLGLAGLPSSVVASDLLRRELFSVIATLVCMGGLAAGSASAALSESTYGRQQAVTAGLAETLPHPPTDSTILLEESCPGDVFRSPDETAGLLAITYRDRSIRGSVVGPRVEVTQNGVRTFPPGGAPMLHRYADRLYVYNEAQREAFELHDADQAHRYFLGYAARMSGCSNSSPLAS